MNNKSMLAMTLMLSQSLLVGALAASAHAMEESTNCTFHARSSTGWRWTCNDTSDFRELKLPDKESIVTTVALAKFTQECTTHGFKLDEKASNGFHLVFRKP